MDSMKPEYKIRQAQGDHGVNLDALRGTLDKLRAIPQLKAGLNGKLTTVTEEREPSPDEVKEGQVKALAQCVATAEGEWIDQTIRRIFREDYIGMSYTRRLRQMKAGELAPMKTMLNELEIEINHREPVEGYVMPDDCILFRRLEITKGGKVRGDKAWEWSKQA